MKSEVSEKWRRHHTTPQERAACVQRVECSGWTRPELARRHGLGLSTLDRWLSQQRSGVAVARPSLREVNLAQMLGQPQWLAEVQHPDGRIVRLSAAARPLVEAMLTSRPC